jgi:asparagine synthase (glutamine-hydrolysing)
MDPPPFADNGSLNATLKHSTEGYGLEKLLRFADRNSMAFSREVRLPFLSHELVEFLFTLPASYKVSGGWTKRILRRAMEPILPIEIARRVDKLGFDPPQRQWLDEPEAGEMIRSCKSRLVSEQVINPGVETHGWQCLMAAKLFEFVA